MAASYPSLAASGVDILGRFDPFDLFAGEGKITTTRLQAADATAVEQFQVVMVDANGRYVPWTSHDLYAYGAFTFTGNPAPADTIAINGHTITFRASGAVADELNIGTTLADTLADLADMINAAPTTYLVSASVNAANTVLNVTAIAAGTGGNTITTTESSTAISVSGATLTDVLATEESPSANAVAICANAVAAATPGAYFSAFTGGIFNHEALVWPGGIDTLAQRKAAFMGTPIGVEQLI